MYNFNNQTVVMIGISNEELKESIVYPSEKTKVESSQKDSNRINLNRDKRILYMYLRIISCKDS